MSRRVGVRSINAALEKLLSQYGDEVEQNNAEIVQKTAQRAAKALREESRQTFGGSGKYAKGWTSETRKGRLRAEATVYNKSAPGLAHLLEHGHANRDGGRTPGRSHIAPVEEAILAAFQKEVEETL